MSPYVRAFPLFAHPDSFQEGSGWASASSPGCSAELGREPGSLASLGFRGRAGPKDEGHFLHPLRISPGMLQTTGAETCLWGPSNMPLESKCSAAEPPG